MKEKIKEAEKAIRAETQLKEKPVAVRIAELKIKITNAVEECKLPPSVIEPILANIYNQVSAAAEKELLHDLQELKKEER